LAKAKNLLDASELAVLRCGPMLIAVGRFRTFVDT